MLHRSLKSVWGSVRFGFKFPSAVAAAALFSWFALPAHPVFAQTAQPAITLVQTETPAGKKAAAQTVKSSLALERAAPLGYRDFGTVRSSRTGAASEVDREPPSQPQIFNFAFHTALKLNRIASAGDFHVVPGGSCAVDRTYVAGDQCTVWMRFTPTGPGHRTGKLILSHSASDRPLIVPTGGDSYASAVSFIPATITTVPATGGNGVGNFSNIEAMAVDGGDNLYIGDFNQDTVSYLDSTGNLTVVAGGGSDAAKNYGGIGTAAQLNGPWGVATDPYGDLFIADYYNQIIRELDTLENLYTIAGGGSNQNSCSTSSPCVATNESISNPTTLATDPSGNVFINFGYVGEIALASETAADYYTLSGAAGESSNSSALAVDASDNLYVTEETDYVGGRCSIVAENRAESEGYAGGEVWPVAGNRNCGYSGDGGPATGAEIGKSVGGFAWDAAGDFYFTDSDNGAVRRIDANTGIIHTIAGHGGPSTAYGDGGSATQAQLAYPYAVAVDSRGNVYVGTPVSPTSYSEAVRVVGGAGQLVFLPQIVGVASAAQTILVTDTGNAPLNLAHATFTSGNTTDFTLDPVTTNCSFTASIQPGQTCKIGVIFKPTVAGNRAATITLTDDTLNGNEIIQVSGVAGTTPAKGALSPASVTFPAQQTGTTSAPFAITLSNTGGVPLEITSESFTGQSKTSFASLSSTCTASLAPGTSCVTQIDFAPAAVGKAAAALTFTTSAGTYSVALAGTGVTTFNLSPSAITFPAETVGVTSAAQAIKLTNTGTAALTVIGTVYITGEFTYSGTTCGASLGVGASCTFSFTFTPSSVGTFTDVVTVQTSAGNLTEALAGTGVLNVSLTPATLNFTSQAVGTASATQVMTLKNTASAPLTLYGYDIGATDFGTKSTCPATVATGASCTISFTFTPTYVGSVQAGVYVETGRGQLIGTLNGLGVAATAAVKLVSALNPAPKGETIALHSTVSGNSTDLPTGTVELLEGATVLAKATLASGGVTFDLAGLAPGTHTLVSHYLGDKLHNPSTSQPIQQVVGAKITGVPVRFRP